MGQFFPAPAFDTGWVPIVAFKSGWSAAAQGAFPAGAVRGIGKAVFLRGLFAKASWGAGESICTLPAGFPPLAVSQIPGNPVGAYAMPDGTVIANAAGSSNFLLTGSFIRD